MKSNRHLSGLFQVPSLSLLLLQLHIFINRFSENTPCNFHAAIRAAKCKKLIPPNKWREITISLWTSDSPEDLGRFIWDPKSKSFINWNISTNELTRLVRVNDVRPIHWKLVGPNLNLTLDVNARYPQLIEADKVSYRKLSLFSILQLIAIHTHFEALLSVPFFHHR